MSKDLIILIASDKKNQNLFFEDKFYNSIKEYVSKNTSIVIISDEVFDLKYYSKQTLFLKIDTSKNNKKYDRNFLFIINSIIEFALYEYANSVKIYKSINDIINKNFYVFNFYDVKLPLKIFINPVDFYKKKNNQFFLDLGNYFDCLINKNKLIENYQHTKLVYFPILERKYMENDEINETYFYWSISTNIFSTFFKRNLNIYSLKYITLRRFFKLSDYISIKLYLLIPFKFKEFVKYIAQRFYYKNKRKFIANEFIITSGFRKKLLFFKYFLAFSQEVSNEITPDKNHIKEEIEFINKNKELFIDMKNNINKD